MRPIVLRLDLPLHEAFDTALNAADDVQLRVIPPVGRDADVVSTLETCTAYQVSSAKDELPSHWHVRETLLERAPDLLFVSTYGAGYDTVDIDACTRRGVCVMNQAGSNSNAVAEHTFGLVLGLTKRISECDAKLRGGLPFARHTLMGSELCDLTLGIVGIGHAGTRVAELAHAFGMNVIATDPLVAPAEIERRGARPMSLQALLGNSDIVTVHCPFDANTRAMFGAREFASMKRGSWFISTARGGIHDEAALSDALQLGHIAGAGLDVWESEPPSRDHPLLRFDNVIATHHIAGVTHRARRQMAAMGSQQLLAALRGTRPPRLVNPEAWQACVSRHRAMAARAAD